MLTLQETSLLIGGILGGTATGFSLCLGTARAAVLSHARGIVRWHQRLKDDALEERDEAIAGRSIAEMERDIYRDKALAAEVKCVSLMAKLREASPETNAEHMN